MRVEHSTLDQVKNRLNMHKLKREREATAALETDPTKHFQEYEERMRRQAEEEEQEKEMKKQRKRDKKEEAAKLEAALAPSEQGDDDMMAMLGFAGFGTSKK